MTDADIAKIEDLLAKAKVDDGIGVLGHHSKIWNNEFISAAKEFLPALLARLKAAEEDLADARHGWEQAAETIRGLEERVKTAQEDRDSMVDCLAEIVRAKEAAGFFDTGVVECLTTMRAARDSARAEGVAEGRAAMKEEAAIRD